jgi:putative NADH-flavin reductase
MKIALFGGTGRTGRPFIDQALAQGHQITALVRDPAKLTVQNPNLTVVKGDVTNPADVQRVVQGADAVVLAIGHTGKSTPRTMMAQAATNVVNAMKAAGVKRVITLTGAGVSAPQDKPGFVDHVFKFLLKTINPDVLADSENHAHIIGASGLDYTIVRGPRLTEGPHTGRYQVGWAGQGMKTQISRADVADFMLKQVTARDYIGLMPMVSD